MNLADLLTERAAKSPDSPAVIHDDGVLRIGAVEAAVWAMAIHLSEAGLKPADVVGLRVRDPLLHLVTIFAMARCGIVHVPLQPVNAGSDDDTTLRRVRAIAVVSDIADAMTTPWRRIAVDPRLPFDPPGEPAPWLRHDQPDWPFSYKTSSGTTGALKLIGVTHAGMISTIARVQAGIGHLPGETFFTTVGMHSDGPRRRYMACIVSGGIAVMRRKFLDAGLLLEMIDRLQIRHFGCLPNHARELLDLVPSGGPRFPDMRCFRLSAAPSDDRLRQLVRDRLCANLVISYGCSELGPMTSADPDLVAQSPGTVGRPLPGVSLEVVDASDTPAPVGTIGVVRARAEGMPSAYFDDAGSTARHFRNGWFYPGDLGVLSPDGELKLLGRADDVMIFDGLKIAPMEIESVLMQHPAVREAAAFPLRSERSFQLPAAAVVLASNVPLAEVQEFARAMMGNRCPQIVLAVPKMPRNPAGKILKRELAELAEIEIRRANGLSLSR